MIKAISTYSYISLYILRFRRQIVLALLILFGIMRIFLFLKGYFFYELCDLVVYILSSSSLSNIKISSNLTRLIFFLVG